VARRVRDYSYEELLERAYSKLPVKSSQARSFNIPRPETMFVGGKTIILNFKDIADTLNRDPAILQKYFSKELGAAAYMNEKGQLVLQGRFNVHILSKLLDIFVQKYVICPTCGSKDTKLIKKGRVFILKCMACGAETTLEAF
jgi:translation initiation factor 2 subunit 2